MIIQKLELKNFIGTKKISSPIDNVIKIDFSNKKNNIILLKGQNGLGKTTILNSLTPFPYFVQRSLKESIIYPAEKRIWIELPNEKKLYLCENIWISETEGTFNIYDCKDKYLFLNGSTKEIKESSVQLIKNNKITEYMDVAETIFGDFDKFKSSVFFKQSNKDFIEAKPTERLNIINKFLPIMDSYDSQVEVISNNIKQTELYITDIKKDIEGIKQFEELFEKHEEEEKLFEEKIIDSHNEEYKEMKERKILVQEQINYMSQIKKQIKTKEQKKDEINDDIISFNNEINMINSGEKDGFMELSIEKINRYSNNDKDSLQNKDEKELEFLLKSLEKLNENEIVENILKDFFIDKEKREKEQKGEYEYHNITDFINELLKVTESALKISFEKDIIKRVDDRNVLLKEEKDGCLFGIENIKNYKDDFYLVLSFNLFNVLSKEFLKKILFYKEGFLSNEEFFLNKENVILASFFLKNIHFFNDIFYIYIKDIMIKKNNILHSFNFSDVFIYFEEKIKTMESSINNIEKEPYLQNIKKLKVIDLKDIKIDLNCFLNNFVFNNVNLIKEEKNNTSLKLAKEYLDKNYILNKENSSSCLIFDSIYLKFSIYIKDIFNNLIFLDVLSNEEKDFLINENGLLVSLNILALNVLNNIFNIENEIEITYSLENVLEKKINVFDVFNNFLIYKKGLNNNLNDYFNLDIKEKVFSNYELNKKEMDYLSGFSIKDNLDCVVINDLMSSKENIFDYDFEKVFNDFFLVKNNVVELEKGFLDFLNVVYVDLEKIDILKGKYFSIFESKKNENLLFLYLYFPFIAKNLEQLKNIAFEKSKMDDQENMYFSKKIKETFLLNNNDGLFINEVIVVKYFLLFFKDCSYSKDSNVNILNIDNWDNLKNFLENIIRFDEYSESIMAKKILNNVFLLDNYEKENKKELELSNHYKEELKKEIKNKELFSNYIKIEYQKVKDIIISNVDGKNKNIFHEFLFLFDSLNISKQKIIENKDLCVGLKILNQYTLSNNKDEKYDQNVVLGIHNFFKNKMLDNLVFEKDESNKDNNFFTLSFEKGFKDKIKNEYTKKYNEIKSISYVLEELLHVDKNNLFSFYNKSYLDIESIKDCPTCKHSFENSEVDNFNKTLDAIKEGLNELIFILKKYNFFNNVFVFNDKNNTYFLSNIETYDKTIKNMAMLKEKENNLLKDYILEESLLNKYIDNSINIIDNKEKNCILLDFLANNIIEENGFNQININILDKLFNEYVENSNENNKKNKELNKELIDFEGKIKKIDSFYLELKNKECVKSILKDVLFLTELENDVDFEEYDFQHNVISKYFFYKINKDLKNIKSLNESMLLQKDLLNNINKEKSDLEFLFNENDFLNKFLTNKKLTIKLFEKYPFFKGFISNNDSCNELVKYKNTKELIEKVSQLNIINISDEVMDFILNNKIEIDSIEAKKILEARSTAEKNNDLLNRLFFNENNLLDFIKTKIGIVIKKEIETLFEKKYLNNNLLKQLNLFSNIERKVDEIKELMLSLFYNLDIKNIKDIKDKINDLHKYINKELFIYLEFKELLDYSFGINVNIEIKDEVFVSSFKENYKINNIDYKNIFLNVEEKEVSLKEIETNYNSNKKFFLNNILIEFNNILNDQYFFDYMFNKISIYNKRLDNGEKSFLLILDKYSDLDVFKHFFSNFSIAFKNKESFLDIESFKIFFKIFKNENYEKYIKIKEKLDLIKMEMKEVDNLIKKINSHKEKFFEYGIIVKELDTLNSSLLSHKTLLLENFEVEDENVFFSKCDEIENSFNDFNKKYTQHQLNGVQLEENFKRYIGLKEKLEDKEIDLFQWKKLKSYNILLKKTIITNTFDDFMLIANKILKNESTIGNIQIAINQLNSKKFEILANNNGELVKDISLLSGAEQMVVSQALGLALASKTTFKTLWIDESDGSLSPQNKKIVISTLHKIIELLDLDQVFIISHQDEVISEIEEQIDFDELNSMYL
jgi:hypothetical protein